MPLIALAPDHAPDAVQVVALVDDHVSVALPPDVTDAALVERVTVGRGSAATVTVVDCTAEPPVPTQVIV